MRCNKGSPIHKTHVLQDAQHSQMPREKRKRREPLLTMFCIGVYAGAFFATLMLETRPQKTQWPKLIRL